MPQTTSGYGECHRSVLSLSRAANNFPAGAGQIVRSNLFLLGHRVRKYAKFGVFYAKIVQTTPLRLRRESLRLPEIFGNK